MNVYYQLPRLLLFAAMLLASCTLAAQTFQWASNGPYGGSITSLLVDRDGIVFVGTATGVFSSSDDGQSWTATSPVPKYGFEYYSTVVTTMALDSAGYLVVATPAGLVRSSDKGSTWSEREQWGYELFCLAIDSDSSIYALNGSNLIRTSWGGPHPVVLGSASFGGRVEAFTVTAGGQLFVAVRSSGLFRSTDRGDSWTWLGTALADTTIAVRELFVRPDGLILMATSHGLLRSPDGATWEPDTSSIRERDIRDLTIIRGQFYAATNRFGVFRSGDLGRTWSEINSGMESSEANVLGGTVAGILFCGTAAGLHRSTDGGSEWSASNQGIAAVPVSLVLTTQRGSILASSPTGVFRSTNAGGSWLQANYQLADRRVFAMCADSSGSVWLVTADTLLYRSTDEGDTWVRTGSTPGNGRIGALSAGSGGELFASALPQGEFLGAVYVSTDGGTSWKIVYDAVVADKIVVTPVAIVLVTFENGVHRSATSPIKWSYSPIGRKSLSPGRPLLCAAAGPSREIYIGSGSGMWLSRNDGLNWLLLPDVSNFLTIRCIAVDPSGQVLAAPYQDSGFLDKGYLVRSTDFGVTWYEASLDQGMAAINAIASRSAGEFFVATDRGVFLTSGPSSGVESIAETTKELELEQSRPNPAGSSSSIAFWIASRRNIRLSLFDARGNEVAQLFNGRAEAGRHVVQLDLDGLTNGIYLCRMVADGEVTARMVTVVR